MIILSEKWEERAKKFEDAGNKMQKLGKKLTIMITIPIGLMLFFGVPGLIGGIILAVLIGIGSK